MIVVARQVKFLLPVRKRVLLEVRFATSEPILSGEVTLHTRWFLPAMVENQQYRERETG